MIPFESPKAASESVQIFTPADITNAPNINLAQEVAKKLGRSTFSYEKDRNGVEELIAVYREIAQKLGKTISFLQLGRLCPPTHGHTGVTEQVLSLVEPHEHTVVFGSANVFTGKPPKNEEAAEAMRRTPFSAFERAYMLSQLFSDLSPHMYGIDDTLLDSSFHKKPNIPENEIWLRMVESIGAAQGKIFIPVGGNLEDIVYYKDRMPLVLANEGMRDWMSGTMLRNAILEGNLDEARKMINPTIIDFAVEQLRQNISIINSSCT